jgi:hypothetical protein
MYQTWIKVEIFLCSLPSAGLKVTRLMIRAERRSEIHKRLATGPKREKVDTQITP